MDYLDKFLHSVSYKFPKGYPDVNDDRDIKMLCEMIRKLTSQSLHEVVKLSASQLDKPFSSKQPEFQEKYEDRGELFLDKLKSKKEFTLIDGSKIILDPEQSGEAIKYLENKEYTKLGGKSKFLIDIDGNSYSLSSFAKTEEFGSGAGSGGGAASTEIQESSQCVVNAIAYNVKKSQITEDDLTDENISKALKYSDISSSDEEVRDFIKNKKDWTNTFINTANVLIQNYSNPRFQQHRGSKFVDSIYNAYKAAKKGAGLSMNNDKWNPADIWMVDSDILDTQFPTEIKALNGLISELYAGNQLIPVSLKKTGKEATIQTYNISEEDKEGYTYESSDSRPTNNNVIIVYSDGKITFRTFNFATNFAGEIKGKTAAHGKIGQGAINDVLRQNNVEPLESPRDIQSSLKSLEGDVTDKFYTYYSKIVEPIDKDEFLSFMGEKDLNYRVSKYLSTQLAYKIENQSPEIQDEIISDIIRYASSSTKSSSVFVKVK